MTTPSRKLKQLKIAAPEVFVLHTAKALQLLKLCQSEHPKLKITKNFAVSDTKSAQKYFNSLPEKTQDDLVFAKQYFESLWQLAWKEAYYCHPEIRGKNWTYRDQSKKLVELDLGIPENPVPLKEKSL